MKVLKDIIDHWGFVDSEQIKELVEHFPNTPLVIKWGMREREMCHAKFVADRIQKVEAESDDYVREVFITTKHFRELKGVFGIE